MSHTLTSIVALALVLSTSAALADESSRVPTTTPPATQPAPAATGQWVYTTQNGWLWMPYGQSYTYVNADTSLAYEYVYYPAFGWHWVSAPWVLGVGPSPYWGAHGYARFAWRAHPWFESRHVGGGHYPMHAAHLDARAFHRGGHGRH